MSRLRLHVLVPPSTRIPSRATLPEAVTDPRPRRDPALELARAADLGGLDGVVLGTDDDGPEAWVTAARLLRRTRHVAVFAGIRPAASTPQYAAKFSASVQRFSRGRFGWFVPSAPGEAGSFVLSAREFWVSPAGLGPVLASHAFPRVLTDDAPRVPTADADPGRLAESLADLAAGGARDVLLDVGDRPGEVLRVAERVLPLLRSARDPEAARADAVAATDREAAA